MSTDIWMPVFIGNYLQEINRLDNAEALALMLLRMEIWTNGPIPDKDSLLARISKMSPKRWQKRRQNVSEYFHLEQGYWTDPGLLAEKQKYEHKQRVARVNGRKGGRPKGVISGQIPETQRVSSLPLPTEEEPIPGDDGGVNNLIPIGDIYPVGSAS